MKKLVLLLYILIFLMLILNSTAQPPPPPPTPDSPGSGIDTTGNGGGGSGGGGEGSSSSCNDKIQNQGETDIDCGGQCERCDIGKKCIIDANCKTGFCNDDTNSCTSPTCFDRLKNGNESDVDCGGSNCPRCRNDANCYSNPDCESNYCGANNKCSTQSSNPNYVNPNNNVDNTSKNINQEQQIPSTDQSESEKSGNTLMTVSIIFNIILLILISGFVAMKYFSKKEFNQVKPIQQFDHISFNPNIKNSFRPHTNDYDPHRLINDNFKSQVDQHQLELKKIY